MRKPILVAVVVTAAIAGAVLAMGPSNASASDDFPAAVVFTTGPNTTAERIIGPTLMVTVDDPNDGTIVMVDLYGPVIVIGPGDDFVPPVRNITVMGTPR